jgi:hypothetical protein
MHASSRLFTRTEQHGLNVRYNGAWLREIWLIPLPLRLMFHPRRLPRQALPGKGLPPACSAR